MTAVIAKRNSDGERVAPGIYLRKGGTYNVQVTVKNRKHRATFDTFEDAVAYRDRMVASRPPKAPKLRRRSLNVDDPESCWGAPEDIKAAREENRRLIKAAPRSTVVIDGREWTVVHLPPTAGGIQ